MGQRWRGRRAGARGRRSPKAPREPEAAGPLTREEAEALISRFAPDFISVHAGGGEFLYASANVREMFGWEPRELLGCNAYAYFHPEDLRRALRRWPRGGAARRQYRLRCADGTWQWVETRGRAEVSRGKVRRLVWLTRAIEHRPAGASDAPAHAEGAAAASFVLRVRAAFAHLGFAKSGTSAAVAREAGVSLRTLQRRLQSLSWSVSKLRTEVFREIAEKMLAVGAPVDEVVARLGFSSRSSFHRAFRRWTGTTPGAFRAPSASRVRG
jgi:PAS domain S-box-containing protein